MLPIRCSPTRASAPTNPRRARSAGVRPLNRRLKKMYAPHTPKTLRRVELPGVGVAVAVLEAVEPGGLFARLWDMIQEEKSHVEKLERILEKK